MRQWQNFGGGGEGHGIGSEYLVFEDREFYILANKVCETQNWSHQGGLENEEIFEGIITYIKTHNNKKKTWSWYRRMREPHNSAITDALYLCINNNVVVVYY